jgi:hypothetical protein
MYSIAPYRLLKGENAWGEFIPVLQELQQVAINRAKVLWNGYEFGGIMPKDGEFGIAPLRMREMAHDVSATTLSGSYSFKRTFGSTGWVTIFDYTTRKDVLHAFAGFAFTDEVLRFLELKWTISDRVYPIIDIQEAKGWSNFGIIVKQDIGDDLIAEPETSVYVRGYCETAGLQTIVPLGFMLYKRKDLIISES